MTFHFSRVFALGALACAGSISATAALAVPAGGWDSTRTHGLALKPTVASQPVASDKALHVIVSLKQQNTAARDTFLHNLHTPGNPQYNQFMTPAQFVAAFSPTSAQVQPVVDYLKASGFRNVTVSRNRTLVSGDGTAAQAQVAFNTQLRQLQWQGKTRFMPVTDVQVPASLNGIVLGVHGLQNVADKLTHLQQTKVDDVRPPLRFGAAAHARDLGAGPHANAADPTSATLTETYTAADLRKAYNADGTPAASNTVVAISTAGTDLHQVIADLHQAERDAGLPYVPTSIVQTAAVPAEQDTEGDGEWALDSQSSSGIGSNVKEMVFYNATDLGDSLLHNYEQFASDNKAKMGNMSYGGCESLNIVLGDLDADDQEFMQANAQGQTWFASSGDAGAACGFLMNLVTPQGGIPQQVEVPASSPYVVGVGGTSLFINDKGEYALETAWTASGGGNSLYYEAPDWQADAGVLGATVVGARGVPDIAMNAGFNLSPAAAFYSTYDTVISGKHSSVIGTSLSSPLAMGVWARMQTAHCNSMGFAAPILYALDKDGGPGSTAMGFIDTIVGTNGGYVAAPGWDYTTGFGSFDITAVNTALPAAAAGCSTANAAPLATLGASGTSGAAPYTVTLNGNGSSDPDHDALAYYVFDFGDGSPLAFSATPTAPAHTYATPGNYMAKLVVRDARGGVSAAVTRRINASGAAQACTLPGITALTNDAAPSLEGQDPQMGNGTDDLVATYLAEPSTQSGKLVVTMKVKSLATIPTGYRWVTYFSTGGKDYYLSMSTANGSSPLFSYGLHGVAPGAGVGTFQYVGALDASSNAKADGTITLVLAKSALMLKTGDVLSAISTSVRTAAPDDTTGMTPGGSGLTVDSAGDPDTYTLLGDNCVVAGDATGGSTTGSTTGGSTTGGTTGGTSGGTTGGTTGGGTTGGTSGGGTGETVTAKLTATPTSGSTPLQVLLDASGSTVSNGTPIDYYTFYFGDDGQPKKLKATDGSSMSYTYTAAGNFDAQVVVTDVNGYNAASQTVRITPTTSVTVTPSDHSIAALTVSPTSGAAPLKVSFDGSRSVGANGNPVTSYTFDFGDASSTVTTTSATVDHVYTKTGNFKPTLSVSDSKGNVSPSKAEALVAVSGGTGATTGGTTGGTGTGATPVATASGEGGGGAFGLALLPLLGLVAVRRSRLH